MLLTVVKSFFHGAFFATSGSCISRRQAAFSDSTRFSASGAKSESCPSPSPAGGGSVTAELCRSVSWRLMKVLPFDGDYRNKGDWDNNPVHGGTRAESRKQKA